MSQPVKVTILDHDYTVACPPEAKGGLLQSADYVDRKMREIRAAGKVVGTDRIAVMAALNIAHELLAAQADNERMADVRQRIAALDARIAEAVDGQ